MTSPLLLLGAVMAVIVAFLFKQTINVKPWIEQRAGENVPGQRQFAVPTAKVGLGVFLAVVTSLFALFISAYFMRMGEADWKSLAMPGVLWVNTGVLVLTSVAVQWTRHAAGRGQATNVRAGLIAGGILTLAFVAGQLWVWQQLNAAGHYMTANPSNAFYFMLTGVHGLHLLGGLWVWGKATTKVLRGAEIEDVRLSVELCSVYWHFLLVVWLVLFALLSSAAPGHLMQH